MGNFFTDPLEKTFNDSAKVPGANFIDVQHFIDVQQVTEKIRIDHGNLQLH